MNYKGNNHRHYRKKMPMHMAGKLISIVQLVLSLGLLIAIGNSKLLPIKYMIAAGIVLLILFALSFGLQFVKSKMYLIGIIISVFISIGLVFGISYVLKAGKAMEKVGGATYKTDNMIVVVKKGNNATTLLDVGSYRFGNQMGIDQDNTNLMVDNVNQILGREVNMTTYETVQELAQALLDGKVEAAIYNEALTGIIEDSISDYSDEVKILYQYGIDTQLVVPEVTANQSFSILISGIDVEGPITTNSRSDVNIIATINPATRQILLTNTPRDYYVSIPGISGEQRDKLTHAGIYGVDVSMATLNQLYSITLDYYVRVNFTSLVKIIDTLGGVEVNSEYAFEAGGYSFQQGANHLDGKAALAFSRERHAFQEGDNQRGKNQEAVITAIIKKMLSPAILTQANDIIANVSDSVETNMTSDKMSELIRMQLENGGDWNIVSTSAIGAGDKQACFSSGAALLYVMQPNVESISQISNKMEQVKNGEVIAP